MKMSTSRFVSLAIIPIIFLSTIDVDAASKISWGSPELKSGEVILNRRVFSRDTTVATNYTVIYKYIRSELSGLISFIEFECPKCNLTGDVRHETNVGQRKETIVAATLNLFDGLEVELWVRIYGFGASMSSRLFTDPFTVEILGEKLFQPKSFALVYAHNATQTRHRTIRLGQRQPGDHLLKFDGKFIQQTTTTHFPESEFEYNQSNAYLTCVLFTFDSPTALLFVNSTNIGDSNFDAIVYDLNRPAFTANMSIYGYFGDEKPKKWKSIIP